MAIVLNYKAELEQQCREVGFKILEYFEIDEATQWQHGIDPHVRAYAIVNGDKELLAFCCVGVPGNLASWQRDMPYGGLMIMLYERLRNKNAQKLNPPDRPALPVPPKRIATSGIVTVHVETEDIPEGCRVLDDADIDI